MEMVIMIMMVMVTMMMTMTIMMMTMTMMMMMKNSEAQTEKKKKLDGKTQTQSQQLVHNSSTQTEKTDTAEFVRTATTQSDPILHSEENTHSETRPDGQTQTESKQYMLISDSQVVVHGGNKPRTTQSTHQRKVSSNQTAKNEYTETDTEYRIEMIHKETQTVQPTLESQGSQFVALMKTKSIQVHQAKKVYKDTGTDSMIQRTHEETQTVEPTLVMKTKSIQAHQAKKEAQDHEVQTEPTCKYSGVQVKARTVTEVKEVYIQCDTVQYEEKATEPMIPKAHVPTVHIKSQTDAAEFVENATTQSDPILNSEENTQTEKRPDGQTQTKNKQKKKLDGQTQSESKHFAQNSDTQTEKTERPDGQTQTEPTVHNDNAAQTIMEDRSTQFQPIETRTQKLQTEALPESPRSNRRQDEVHKAIGHQDDQRHRGAEGGRTLHRRDSGLESPNPFPQLARRELNPSPQLSRREPAGNTRIVYLSTADTESNGYPLFKKFVGFISHLYQVVLSIQPLKTRHDVPVILPCVGASRLGSDVSASLAKAKLPPGCLPILILIHPRAYHNSRVFPTRQKGSDFLKDTEAVFDIVVWEDKIYDCKQNQDSAKELLAFLEKTY